MRDAQAYPEPVPPPLPDDPPPLPSPGELPGPDAPDIQLPPLSEPVPAV